MFSYQFGGDGILVRKKWGRGVYQGRGGKQGIYGTLLERNSLPVNQQLQVKLSFTDLFTVFDLITAPALITAPP